LDAGTPHETKIAALMPHLQELIWGTLSPARYGYTPDMAKRDASDAYQAKFMKGDAALHRSKVVSRPLAILLGFFALLFFITALTTAITGVPVLAITMGIGGLFMLFCALGLSVIRTIVTADEIHVQYGLWGPRVAIARIRSCRAIDYDWVRFGGFGIKRSLDGTWAYTLDMKGRVVELVYEDERGRPKTVVFTAQSPEAVVLAVEQARSGAYTGPRIDTAVGQASSVELEAEAEAQAEDEQSAPGAARSHR
jgi:hypothetical protein